MTAREAALRGLYDIEISGKYMNTALKEALSRNELSERDKALITELMYGVVSNKSAVDYIISSFSSIKLNKINPWVLNILRMGVFQICYMDKIPHSAACNEAVKLAKKYSHAAGFVNGVLRNVSRNSGEIVFPQTGNVVSDLSLKYSYPEWITEKLVAEYGERRTRELFEENSKAHCTMLRANRLKITAEELVPVLKSEGIECEAACESENAVIVKGRLNIEGSQAYKEGLYSVQNISSMRAVEALDPQAGELVIDMCAAPGGKSCAAAEKMNNTGRIISFDLFEHKIELIQNSARRLGINIIEAKKSDSSKICTSLFETADKVLADVPCSGFGVIHKKPDIKWSRKEEDIPSLCAVQQQILEAAAVYVKRGGVLVYSTCTVLPEENRMQTERFLNEHSEFKKVSEEQILTGGMGESGFYICKLLKERSIYED